VSVQFSSVQLGRSVRDISLFYYCVRADRVRPSRTDQVVRSAVVLPGLHHLSLTDIRLCASASRNTPPFPLPLLLPQPILLPAEIEATTIRTLYWRRYSDRRQKVLRISQVLWSFRVLGMWWQLLACHLGVVAKNSPKFCSDTQVHVRVLVTSVRHAVYALLSQTWVFR